MYIAHQILEKLREAKPFLQKKYPIAQIGLFGSYARGEATEDSDIDILVEFNASIGWGIMDFVEDLDNLFGQPVDLVTRNAIKGHHIEKFINRDILYV